MHINMLEKLGEANFVYKFQQYYIPLRMNGGIKRYAFNGVRPGDFLQAVISNDLREACVRADEENMDNLPAYVSLFYNHFPIGSWGSPEAMERWINRGGLIGKTKEET